MRSSRGSFAPLLVLAVAGWSCGGSSSPATGGAGSGGASGTGWGAAGAGGTTVAGTSGAAGTGAAGTGAAGTGAAGNVGASGGRGGAAGTGGASGGRGGAAGSGGAGRGGSGGSARGGAGGSTVVGCTGSGAVLDPSVYAARKPSASNRYLPLAVGAHWGWQETDVATGASGMKQSWVEALETLTGSKAGIAAFRVRSETLTGGTLNWQQDVGTTVTRHRSQFLDMAGAITSSDELAPSQLRLDETTAHLTAGTTWTETYADTKTRASGAVVSATLTVTWRVEAVNETVTVPAGTFSCLRIHRIEPASAIDSSGGDNVYWFARGVGKVKETGTVTHELLGYCYP